MDLYPRILKDGVIKPPIEKKRYSWLNNTVFFSWNDDFEFSSLKPLERESKIKLMSIEEQQKLFGIFRIGILINTPGVVDFARFVESRKAPKTEVQSLIKFWEDKGANPEDWFCYPGAVPNTNWKMIEVLNADEWELNDNILEYLNSINLAKQN